MDPPRLLLDALKDSITSGTFIDTKFYVFSRRETSGRVGSPRALYCNSRILDTVPYFSTLFSDSFPEEQPRDINEGFPSDFYPYVEHYDYLSDSDLEDESPCAEWQDSRPLGYKHKSKQGLGRVQDSQSVSSDLSSSTGTSGARGDDRPTSDDLARMGKVAIIHDMGALTFKAMLYYLYTGEIEFAPFSSDPRYEHPAQTRIGNWSTGKLPLPSAKSVYRLADKYDIPTLKELAKTHIYHNLEHCDLVEEVFSSFSSSFPEIASMQVLQLIDKVKEESKVPWATESVTKKRLLEKIATLPQSELAFTMDTLTLIWNGMKGVPEPPKKEPKKKKIPFSATRTKFPNWHRVKLALLKSIPTGCFIDVQFYACNAFGGDLPLNPRPLFTSSIVIEEWGPAITALTAGPTDDYESWGGGLYGGLHKGKAVLQYRTEAGVAKNREVMMLMSGAWKTWISFLSYVYTNKMTFVTHWISTHNDGLVVGPKARTPHPCSPHSMYSLAARLGVESIKRDALKGIQSELSASNIIQELFSSFTASHEEVLDMEIQFFHEKAVKTNPRLMDECIRKMGSGEAPFFPTKLGLVYDKLVTKAPFDTHPSGPTEAWLRCIRCYKAARLQDLYKGLRCPQCPSVNGWKRPIMQCTSCNLLRSEASRECAGKKCGRRFM